MILDDIDKYIPQFIKVIPYDYKMVMQEQKLEELKRKKADVEMDVEFNAGQ
jgi:glutamate synthase (NADPH/NADH) large chain